MLYSLTLSYFRTYIYVRNPKTVATPVRIYTYTDFTIEIWGFYQRLTDTLWYHPMSCSRASRSVAPISQHVYQVYSEFSAVFGKFWKITIVGPRSIHRLVWNTSGALYGFSAVKVKLVDSLIWRPFILSWNRPRKPMTRLIWHMCEFLFWTIRSLNVRTFIDALCNNCY